MAHDRIGTEAKEQATPLRSERLPNALMEDRARRQTAGMALDPSRIVVDEVRFVAFVRALDNAPPPGRRLKQLMQRRPLWSA
jgi:uncharacterized protein (DUF1778 family)